MIGRGKVELPGAVSRRSVLYLSSRIVGLIDWPCAIPLCL